MRVALVTLVLLSALAAPPHAADDPPAGLLSDFGAQYQRAVVAHDARLAARLRTETRLLSAAEGTPALAHLERTLRATRDPLHPWPLAAKVDRLVADAAIIVFREGLEAVLILAAITASFVGARRRLRRPVLLGGLAGIAATAVTWGLAQLLVSELGAGGLRLEAITGLLAIAVLLVVTHWFFHRVYWSQWIARFNRQRKRLEGVGFLSGQAIGLAATLAVGGVTFVAQRKLPYRRMLIATGVLIALVLAVMTGTTVHVMQGLGWLPSTPTGFTVPPWANRWLGISATWEGIECQLGALVFVVGSYVVARELQSPSRRAHRLAAARQQA